MPPMTDAHVHFFTTADLRRVAGALPYSLPEPHPLTRYLDGLIAAGCDVDLLNNVHLSILPDSENVFESFDELARLQDSNPEKYGKIRIIGTILADPAYADAARLAHPQVKGVRIVLHDAKPEQIGARDFCDAAWLDMYARLRADQHVHVYAQDPTVNLQILRRLPESVSVGIDHLGTCQPARGVDDPDYVALLLEARARGNVFFKGPGYRTANRAAEVAPFAARIAELVGPDKLILQASDAPHVGKDQDGTPFQDLFTPRTALDFSTRLAGLVADGNDASTRLLLNGAAATTFHLHQ